MAAPIIKVHRVPDSYDPNLDIGESYNLHDIKTINNSSSIEQRNCRLIERAVDGTLSSISDAYGFSPYTLIKLTPISIGSKTYKIDVGAGQYHDTNKPTFFTENNWITGNSSSWNLEDWVLDHREFAPPGGEINPRFLQFQLFIKKQSVFLSNPGTSGDSIALDYTYIPSFGAYSFRWNETGHPGNDLNFFGDFDPIYQEYNSDLDQMVWAGQLNYTIDRINKTITFSDSLYDEETIGSYEVYMRMFVYRTNNIHSDSKSGAARSSDYIYYAIPHDDLVAHSAGLPSFTGISNSYQIQEDQGIIRYERTTINHYPASNVQVLLNAYQYHRWIRIGNDMTDDFIFKKYIKAGTSTDFNDIYNYEDEDTLGVKGLVENPPTQSQQTNVNYTYGDIKITNEALHDPINPPQLIDLFVDFLPRGNVSGNQNQEQITYGIAGLINEFRPWDHQEGGAIETYQACFARATRNYINLYQKPIEVFGGSPPSDIYNGGSSYGGYSTQKNQIIYDNPMNIMNAAQAWQLKRWYLSSPMNSSGGGLQFRISSTIDDIMKDIQSGSESTVILEGTNHSVPGSNTIFVRLIYILFDGGVSPTIKVPVVTAPKTWSMKIRGDYLE